MSTDWVSDWSSRPRCMCETAASSTPSPQRGFFTACDDLKIERRYVVYPGEESFALRHGAQAIGLAAMVELLVQPA